MPAHSLIGPDEWERQGNQIYDTLWEIAERLGPEAAKLAAQRAGYTLKEFIETGGTTSMPEKKILSGRNVYRSGEERQRPTQRSAAEIAHDTEQAKRNAEESTRRTNEALALAEKILAEMGVTTTTTNTPDPSDARENLISKCMHENSIDYAEASSRVMNENPDLYEQYRDGAIKVGARLYKEES